MALDMETTSKPSQLNPVSGWIRTMMGTVTILTNSPLTLANDWTQMEIGIGTHHLLEQVAVGIHDEHKVCKWRNAYHVHRGR